jgi:hypothetical protein
MCHDLADRESKYLETEELIGRPHDAQLERVSAAEHNVCGAAASNDNGFVTFNSFPITPFVRNIGRSLVSPVLRGHQRPANPARENHHSEPRGAGMLECCHAACQCK